MTSSSCHHWGGGLFELDRCGGCKMGYAEVCLFLVLLSLAFPVRRCLFCTPQSNPRLSKQASETNSRD